MYIYMNCLNISLVDSRGGRTRAGVGIGAGTGLKSGSKEPEVVEPDLLGVLSSCTILPLGVESLSSLLGATELCEKFL